MVTHGVAGGKNHPCKEMSIPCTYCDEYGNEVFDLTLTETSHLVESHFNLLSLSRMMKHGWSMEGDENSIIMSKGKQRLELGIKVPTAQGMLFCVCLRRKAEVHAGANGKDKPISIAKAHALLGHHNETSTRKTAKALGWTISRVAMQPCKECAVATAKQKNVPKKSSGEAATKANARWFDDIATVKAPKGK